MIAAGHGWGLAVFPLAASAVAFVFAGVLGRRFARKRRASEGAWTAALLMYAVGSLAMFLGVVRGWTIGDYRTYWLFGAVLNVPYLFLGEVYLLTRWRAVGHGLALVLVALSAFAAVSVWSARLHGAALGSALPLGKDAFGHGATPYRLAQYYALPAYFLLLGGLTWSAWAHEGPAGPEGPDRRHDLDRPGGHRGRRGLRDRRGVPPGPAVLGEPGGRGDRDVRRVPRGRQARASGLTDRRLALAGVDLSGRS